MSAGRRLYPPMDCQEQSVPCPSTAPLSFLSTFLWPWIQRRMTVSVLPGLFCAFLHCSASLKDVTAKLKTLMVTCMSFKMTVMLGARISLQSSTYFQYRQYFRLGDTWETIRLGHIVFEKTPAPTDRPFLIFRWRILCFIFVTHRRSTLKFIHNKTTGQLMEWHRSQEFLAWLLVIIWIFAMRIRIPNGKDQRVEGVIVFRKVAPKKWGDRRRTWPDIISLRG